MFNDKLREINARIGVMSLRERLFVFVAAVVVTLALVQTLFIDSGQLRTQTANLRLQGAEASLQQIDQQRQLLAQRAVGGPDAAAQKELAALEARLSAMSADLDVRQRTLVPPDHMRQVLKDVMRGQSGVRIVGFRTLNPQPVALPDAAEDAPPGFYRHGFEVTVSGRYTELVNYLARLEALPWNLSWVEARLDAESRPELSLTLTVHTLSLEEAWLRV